MNPLKTLINFVVVVTISLLAISCNNKGYEFPKAPEQVFLTEENMPPVEYFTLEKVEVPEVAEMDERFFVYADTLLITVQNRLPKPYLLSVYNLKTKKLIAGYFTKGGGPNELITAYCIFRKNEIFVVDVVQNKWVVLNIDSILSLKNNYVPTIIQTDGICTEITRCVNDTLIGINDFHFYGFGYDNVPEFVKVSCTDGKFPVGSIPKTMKNSGPMSINMRISYFNEHTRQYIVAWRNFPYIDIFDESFNLQKQYIGPDNEMPNIVESNDIGVFWSVDSIRTKYYSVGCQIENYTILLNDRFCSGRYEWKKLNPEIYCFDKSLNMVRRFKQKDEDFKSVIMFPSYCEKSGNLYFNMEDDNNDMALYKCIFEK